MLIKKNGRIKKNLKVQLRATTQDKGDFTVTSWQTSTQMMNPSAQGPVCALPPPRDAVIQTACASVDLERFNEHTELMTLETHRYDNKAARRCLWAKLHTLRRLGSL